MLSSLGKYSKLLPFNTHNNDTHLMASTVSKV